ncbi:MAG TPA: NAD(P)/FAD-dependent oxidoreductase [Flavisolibacter sp.]|nr:NAD(P)/FAD-dependent oxidoreductase [Flavisolibacter sp.]
MIIDELISNPYGPVVGLVLKNGKSLMLTGKKDFDAIVVGSGPNGLAAAITMQQEGLSVLLIEGKDTVGGGLRTRELTLPGFLHDVCSAIHPLAIGSPFFHKLPLLDHGLQFIHPPIPAAHPFDDGSAAALLTSIDKTAAMLTQDERPYLELLEPLVESWSLIAKDVLGPLHMPQHPLLMARFGWKALTPATYIAKQFRTKEARALWSGMAAHSMQPLSNPITSAIALVLLITGHTGGWPIAKGGSQSIAQALSSYFISLGGKIETNSFVRSLQQLPSAHAVLFDVTPRQLLQIAGHSLSAIYNWQLKRYRYGMGVYKIDWALDDPIPFTAPYCRQAGTVHLGNTLEEIVATEKATANGAHPDNPFVLLAQPSIFDVSRAPQGKHTAWAYCHVPNASTLHMTDRIENQVERFAPGFKDRILARHGMNTAEMEDYNPNYVGGDINGGSLDICQLFTRPALRWSPYKTSAKGLYLCSSSTPPGGGVHGMCGYYAAKKALKEIFGLEVLPLGPMPRQKL